MPSRPSRFQYLACLQREKPQGAACKGVRERAKKSPLYNAQGNTDEGNSQPVSKQINYRLFGWGHAGWRLVWHYASLAFLPLAGRFNSYNRKELCPQIRIDRLIAC